MPFVISSDAVIKKSAKAAWRDLDGETVVLNLVAKMVYGFNGGGGLVWTLIDGSRSIGDIARAIAADSGAQLDEVLADVLAFTGQLADKGLVELV